MRFILFFFLLSFATHANFKLESYQVLPKRIDNLEFALGGLSGWVHESPYFYAISDSSGANGANRIIRMKYNSSFKFIEFKELILKNSGDQDFEGIALTKNSFILGHEGPEALSLYEFKRNGEFLRRKKLPQALRKIQHNRGHEGISSFKNTLLAVYENPLKKEGIANRALFLDIQSLKVKSNYAYLLDAIPSRYEKPDYGLSEVLLIDEKSFYSMERGFDKKAKENWIKIFKNTIDRYTTNLGLQNPRDISWSPMIKELVLDFDEIRNQLPKEFQTLDNFEAMAFGPEIEGKKTIWVISDDNFSKYQDNLILIFSLQ